MMTLAALFFVPSLAFGVAVLIVMTVVELWRELGKGKNRG